MSAENYLLITQLKKGWKLTERVMDTDAEFPVSSKKKYKTLLGAVRDAQMIQDADMVEYGVYFDLLPRKLIKKVK